MEVKDLNYREDDGYILTDKMKAPEIYADGISEILMGYPMVKITLHTVIEAGEKELRKACLMLAMDAPSALEMAFEILDAYKNSADYMNNMAEISAPKRMKAFLDRIPPIEEVLEHLPETAIVPPKRIRKSAIKSLKGK